MWNISIESKVNKALAGFSKIKKDLQSAIDMAEVVHENNTKEIAKLEEQNSTLRAQALRADKVIKNLANFGV